MPVQLPSPVEIDDSFQAITNNVDDAEQQHLQSKLNFVKSLSLVIAIIACLGSLSSLGTLLVDTSNLSSLAAGLAAFSFSLASYLIAKLGKTSLQYEVTAYLLIGSVWVPLAIVHIQENTPSGVLSIYLALAVLGGLLDLGRKARWVVYSLTYLMLLGFFFLDEVRRLAKPAPGSPILDYSLITCLTVSYIIIIGGIAIFSNRQKRTAKLVETQNYKLSQLVQLLSSTTQFGSTLSQDLSNVTTKLSNTSIQHSADNQQVVGSLSEVTSSLEELSQTAVQINQAATVASDEISQTVNIANQLIEAGEVAEFTAQEGTQAVIQTMQSVEKVRNWIELLGQRLLSLTAQTRKANGIIDLIDEIADETHLLALNASIEAAGPVGLEQNYSRDESRENRQNERFGIIAQEVKNLADRSRESTEEVRQAMTEMQGAVAAAVLVAEEGKKETAAALLRSQVAGAVIDKLNEVISNTTGRADQIRNAADSVKQRAEEISIATGQQRSANVQILSTMQQLSHVSKESVEVVYQLSEAANQVNQQVAQLNTLLVQSNLSLVTA